MLGYYFGRIIKNLQIASIKNSIIHGSSNIGAGSQIINVKMKRYSYCGYDCKIINCEIGAFTSIASNVVIGAAEHPVDWLSTSCVFYSGKRAGVCKKFIAFDRCKDKVTTIGNDVWIGEGVFVKSGVKIGDGSVVGMGSVVTKDIPPYEIWAGNPARKIKNRFSDGIRDRMLKLKWWEWDDEKIQKYAKYVREPSLWLGKVNR